jgi:hypothetical protein
MTRGTSGSEACMRRSIPQDLGAILRGQR